MPEPVQIKHEPTTRDFLNVVFRWKFLILAVVFLTTFFIVFVRASKPKTFSSSSRVLLERGERPSVYAPNPRYPDWAEEMSSQLEVILSEAVFSHARKMFADSLATRGLRGTRAFNAGAVRADVVGESNVIAITYSSRDPVESELGCAAVTQAYVTYYREATAPPPVTDFFVSEVDDALAELTRWRQRKSDFLNREQFMGAQEESSHLTFKLSRLETDVADMAGELSAQKIRVERLTELSHLSDAELDERLSAMSTDSAVQSRVLADLRLDLLRLKTKRQELLTLYTEKHPEVTSVENQIVDIEGQLRNEIQNALALAVNEYDELRAKYESISREKDQTEEQIALLPEKEKELSRIDSNIRSYEDKYRLLLQKQHEAEIAIATSEQFEVKVLTPPGRATTRRGGDYVRLAVGPFLSLIVGLGLAFFLESMDHSLKNTAEVEQYLKTAVLATVSEVDTKE